PLSGPSPGFVSLRQGSNAPPRLFRRAQSPSTRPPSIADKRRAVLHERPLKKPDFRDPSPGTRKCRIFLEGALKESERFPQILLATFVREVETLQIKVVSLRVPLFVGGKRNGQLDLERVNNCASDFILQRKHALQFAFVSFRPKLKTAPRIN